MVRPRATSAHPNASAFTSTPGSRATSLRPRSASRKVPSSRVRSRWIPAQSKTRWATGCQERCQICGSGETRQCRCHQGRTRQVREERRNNRADRAGRRVRHVPVSLRRESPGATSGAFHAPLFHDLVVGLDADERHVVLDSGAASTRCCHCLGQNRCRVEVTNLAISGR